MTDKTYPDRSAFPNRMGDGLTKREYFAALAMQGILANDELVTSVAEGANPQESLARAVARHSTIYADALIEALNSNAS